MCLSSNEDRLDKIEKKIKKGNDKSSPYPDDFYKFTKLIGLPKHPATLKAMDFMQHQREFVTEAINKVEQKIHFNKSRQIGYTEMILQVLQFMCFTKY